jgi:hypothetical protein
VEPREEEEEPSGSLLKTINVDIYIFLFHFTPNLGMKVVDIFKDIKINFDPRVTILRYGLYVCKK